MFRVKPAVVHLCDVADRGKQVPQAEYEDVRPWHEHQQETPQSVSHDDQHLSFRSVGRSLDEHIAMAIQNQLSVVDHIRAKCRKLFWDTQELRWCVWLCVCVCLCVLYV